MTRAVLVAVGVLTAGVLAGCGSAQQGSGGDGSGDSGAHASAKVGACATDSPAVTGARTVGSADLDGDGTPERVRLTAPAGSGCPDTLFATVRGTVLSTRLSGDGLPLSQAYAVDVPGRRGQLLVTRQDHPRGGFQLRVWGVGRDSLSELTVGGTPLVPFAATDVQEHPFSVDCRDGAVVLTEAVAHQPVGVVAAWDVRRTTYAVSGATVTKGASQEIADNVLPAQLSAKYPALSRHEAFATCRAG